MDQDRFARLLDRYFDESLTPGERQEFEQLLLGSSEARQVFWERARFHSLLREFGERSWGAQLAAQPEAVRASFFMRVKHWLGALYDSHVGWAIATILVVFVGYHFGFRRSPESAEPTTSAIAVLTQAVDAQWADHGNPRAIGSSLSPGWLKLKTGMVQVEFISGARVILEGPAELQLVSPMEAFCRAGKLTAEVPPPAHGFKVRSPGATVIDLGTAFGLNVQKSGDAVVQVLRGEVEVHRGSSQRGLVEGQGVHVGADGSMDDVGDVADSAYPSSELLAQRAAQGWQRKRNAWLAATKKFSADPALAIHYTFEEPSTWSRVLHNGAKNTPVQTDGSIVGCRWGEGHWPGKRALEFHGVTDRVRFNLPGEYEAMTMAAWVRVDSLDLDLTGLMMAEGWGKGALHWQFTRKGTVRLGVHDARDFDSPPVITPDRYGQWVHLAVVCDRATGHVSHYLDGQPISSEPMKLRVPIKIGNAELGSWSPSVRQDQRPIRNLAGSMDEFFLFTRALSDGEVRELYQAADAIF